MTQSISFIKPKFRFAILLFYVLGSVACGTSGADKVGDWQIEFTPGSADYYAALHMLSKSSGEYKQMYAHDGKWNVNPNVPSPKTSIAKGDMRMQYVLPTISTLPTLNLYSGSTGQWEQFYLNAGEWLKNDNFTQPNIGITKADLNMEFIPATSSALPGLIVTSGKTKEIEIFYFQDGQWRINTFFPKGKSL